MDTDDNLTSKKDPTGKLIAQRMDKMKERQEARANTEPTLEADKDEDSGDEYSGIVKCALAQQLKETQTGQRQKK